jgi:hypothetical protein
MKRFLKRRISRSLPETLRVPVKPRHSAKFAEPVNTTFFVAETPSALQCGIDTDWSFPGPLVCENDLASWTDTPEGRAEFQSLARAARVTGVLFDIGANSGLNFSEVLRCEATEPSFCFRASSTGICGQNGLVEMLRKCGYLLHTSTGARLKPRDLSDC